MPDRARPLRVLFLCTGNSCRSQMAEGFARMAHGNRLEAQSAGLVARGLDPRAVQAMAEAGVDIAGHTSKRVDQLGRCEFDLVLTVCGKADEKCPVFPGAPRVVHVGFDDPLELARDATDDEQAMKSYRRVRDEIRDFVRGMLDDGSASVFDVGQSPAAEDGR